jgi:flagellar hook protein FlgE
MGFHHGLSGLNASSKNLDVIGHNIANSNTVGFKNARAEFNEMVASAMGASAGNNAGIGVSVAAVSQQFSQGVITPSSNGLDMAINGDGFFVVEASGTQAFTRNGAFQLNKDGFLVSANGDKVQGWKDASLTGAPLGDLQFPAGTGIAGKSTTQVSIQAGNLPATAPNAAVDNTPRQTYGTSVTVYDSQGVSHPVQLYFVKSENLQANPAYEPEFLADGVTSNPAHQPALIDDGTGTMIANPNYIEPQIDVGNHWAVYDSLTSATPIGEIDFDGTGALVTQTPLNLSVNPHPRNPNLPPTPFNVSLELTGMTQSDRSWSIDRMAQDGFASGQLTSVNVASDGTLMASYSNGLTRAEGRVAVARFTNNQGLEPAGNNNWTWTADAGPVLMGSAGEGSFGTIQGGALEESNVDLTAQLVGMMTAQRAYQANAQTIKTQDQIFSTLVNLR